MCNAEERNNVVIISHDETATFLQSFCEFFVQETDLEDPMGKTKQQDNPFIEPSQQHTVVDMKGEIGAPITK